MYEHILYEVEDPVALIVLNRPEKLNAWTDRMGLEVRHALEQAERDERVVGIIITGAGRAFCAGADMSRLQAITEGKGKQKVDSPAAEPGDASMDPGFRHTLSYIASVRKPVIAAINGPCVGMAVIIACFCDMRIASEKASFHTAFARRGLIAEWGSSWLLPRLIGVAHTMDIMFSARKVKADEAERMGLVNRVVPEGELLDHVKAYVRELAENCSPRSMAIMKRQIYQHLLTDFSTAINETQKLMTASFTSEDFKEGVESFVEKRPPKFSRVSGD